MALTPTLSDLLDEIVGGPLFSAEELPQPSDEERAAPKPQVEEEQQLSLDSD